MAHARFLDASGIGHRGAIAAVHKGHERCLLRKRLDASFWVKPAGVGVLTPTLTCVISGQRLHFRSRQVEPDLRSSAQVSRYTPGPIVIDAQWGFAQHIARHLFTESSVRLKPGYCINLPAFDHRTFHRVGFDWSSSSCNRFAKYPSTSHCNSCRKGKVD